MVTCRRASVRFGVRHCKYFINFFDDFVAMEILQKIRYDWVAMDIHETNPTSSVQAVGLFSSSHLSQKFKAVIYDF